jgi:hypothetical protein
MQARGYTPSPNQDSGCRLTHVTNATARSVWGWRKGTYGQTDCLESPYLLVRSQSPYLRREIAGWDWAQPPSYLKETFTLAR